MYTGPLKVTNEEIYDILKNLAYSAIIEKYRNENFEFLIMNDKMFRMPMPYKRQDVINVSRNSDTNELLDNEAPITFEQAAKKIKQHWETMLTTLRHEVQAFVTKCALDQSYPEQNRPKDFEIDPMYEYKIQYRIQDDAKINQLFVKLIKGIRAAITHEGYDGKKVVSVFAGKYINWLGREDSQYLYAKVGKNVSVPAFNLLQRDRRDYKLYMEDPRTKNWTIAVSHAVAVSCLQRVITPDNPSYVSTKYEDNTATVSQLINYAKKNRLTLTPYFEDQVFQHLSPRLVKDTYLKYPQQLHRLVALIAENDIDIPTYTMCKMLIYKDKHMHTSTIAVASALSHAATKDYRTTQVDAWNQLKSYKYHRNDTHYIRDINVLEYVRMGN